MRFSSSGGIRVLNFDSEAVVFDSLSWDVHLLNPAAIAVLELILEAPRSQAEVVAFLEEALKPNEQAAASVHGERLLQDLMSLGLIRAVPSCAHR